MKVYRQVGGLIWTESLECSVRREPWESDQGLGGFSRCIHISEVERHHQVSLYPMAAGSNKKALKFLFCVLV